MTIIEQFVQAVNYRDSDQIVALFSDDAVVISHLSGRKQNSKGHTQIKKWIESLEADATFTMENSSLDANRGRADFTYVNGSIQKGSWEFEFSRGKIKKLNIHVLG